MTKRRPFGSVRRLPSGRWQARYRDAQNVRRAAPDTFSTEQAARDWLVGIEADIIRGRWRDPDAGRISFREWSVEYMANAIHKRERTRYKDESILRRRLVPVFGDMAIGDIEQRHVQAFVTETAKHYAKSTVETEYSLLRTILGAAAIPGGPLEVNPCHDINLPDGGAPKKRRRVTIDELAVLAGHAHKRYRALIWLAGTLGLRWSEVAGLRVGRISFLGTPSITIVETVADVGGRKLSERTKNESSERVFLIPPVLRDMLAAHLASEGRAGQLDALVFTAPRGGPLDYSDFHDGIWAPAVAAAGLEGLTFHGLRHSSAGLLRQLGIHTQVIADWLGHRDDSPITSSVYGWVPDATEVAAAAALNKAIRKASGHARGTKAAGGDTA